MGRKKYYLVLDTETCEDVDVNPIPYDIGWAICDRHGNIFVERSYVVADSFLDLKDSMKTAYYAEKIPSYWEDIKKGTRTLSTMWNIRKRMIEDMRHYNINTVCAYNMAFDQRALNNLIRYTTKSKYRYWFPFGTKYECIWHETCQLLASRKSYIKFCLQNGLVSPSGNTQTGAEMVYKYLTKNPDFIESHTGLEDVRIEVSIMAKCFQQKKKMDRGINRLCWRIPQTIKKQMVA